ncbi:MAG: hypothetical protein KGI50_06825 [Patescibacteria group bacterium]|nr:hypothetical protein [Patescibacteria group bacterium]MDE2439291.1 hypothetical protein [Patescibacteria group bacterium]
MKTVMVEGVPWTWQTKKNHIIATNGLATLKDPMHKVFDISERECRESNSLELTDKILINWIRRNVG